MITILAMYCDSLNCIRIEEFTKEHFDELESILPRTDLVALCIPDSKLSYICATKYAIYMLDLDRIFSFPIVANGKKYFPQVVFEYKDNGLLMNEAKEMITFVRDVEGKYWMKTDMDIKDRIGAIICNSFKVIENKYYIHR